MVMMGWEAKLPESGVPRCRLAIAGVLGDIGARLSDPVLLIAMRCRMEFACMLFVYPILGGPD